MKEDYSMISSRILLWFVTGLSILVLAGAVFCVDEWKSADIGDTQAGSTDINGDVITIVANGADIWGAADGGRDRSHIRGDSRHFSRFWYAG